LRSIHWSLLIARSMSCTDGAGFPEDLEISPTVSTIEYHFAFSSLANPGAVHARPTPVLAYYIKGSIRTANASRGLLYSGPRPYDELRRATLECTDARDLQSSKNMSSKTVCQSAKRTSYRRETR
jgi:hypothetical protein